MIMPSQGLVITFRLCRAFVDLLCDDGVDVNTEYAEEQGKTLLQLAVGAGRLDWARELLRLPACDPNLPHRLIRKCPLHTAVEQGSPAMVRLLLDSGADVNAKVARTKYCFTELTDN